MESKVLKSEKPPPKHYYPPLPFVELCGCFFIWVGGYVLSIYPLLRISKENTIKYYNDGYLEEGWRRWTGRYQDTADFEWSFWTKYLWEVIVIGLTGHFVIARIGDVFCPMHRFKVYIAYSMVFTMYFLRPPGLLFILAHCLVQYLAAALTKSIAVCWVTGISLIYTLSSTTCTTYLKKLYDDEDKAYFLLFATAMCNLRYIGFSLEYVWSHHENRNRSKHNEKNDMPSAEKIMSAKSAHSNVRQRKGKTDSPQSVKSPQLEEKDKTNLLSTLPLSFFDLIIYQMYFPLFYGGPIINYNEFALQIRRPPLKWTRKTVFKFILGMMRYTFWHLFIDFILHFIYLSSMPGDISTLKNMPLLALCGLSFCQVYFFYMKYVIMYGMPSHFSMSDNLDIPKGPQCVGSKHRMTDMWKYFDKGLHKWLVRYIFIPCGGSNVTLLRGVFNSMLPFAFVCYWHGGTRAQMHWAFLSWFGVYIEGFALKFYKMEKVQDFEAKYISPQWSRRIRGAFSSLTFGLLMTSNLYFLSGTYVGNLYWKRFYQEDAFATFLMHLSLYGGVQCSMEFQRMGI